MHGRLRDTHGIRGNAARLRSQGLQLFLKDQARFDLMGLGSLYRVRTGRMAESPQFHRGRWPPVDGCRFRLATQACWLYELPPQSSAAELSLIRGGAPLTEYTSA